jgi:hypothetical protein
MDINPARKKKKEKRRQTVLKMGEGSWLCMSSNLNIHRVK